MVIKQANADEMWPMASHHPATRNQMTLPINPAGPVPRSPRPDCSLRLTASCPNGHSENRPITKHDRAQGSPTMVMAHTSPASHQPTAMTRPPRTTHKMLSRELIMTWLWRVYCSFWLESSGLSLTGDHGMTSCTVLSPWPRRLFSFSWSIWGVIPCSRSRCRLR